jgi:hypothetical protein
LFSGWSNKTPSARASWTVFASGFAIITSTTIWTAPLWENLFWSRVSSAASPSALTFRRMSFIIVSTNSVVCQSFMSWDEAVGHHSVHHIVDLQLVPAEVLTRFSSRLAFSAAFSSRW